MIFLIDHNIERQATILLGNLASQGWLELIPIRFVTFEQVSLPVDSDDRLVWRFAQENKMILLTANRNMKDEESLEQVMRQENTPTSLPVLTIGKVERLYEPEYRQRCSNRIVEIVMYINDYMGAGRIFIP
jgi:hypothetical protein